MPLFRRSIRETLEKIRESIKDMPDLENKEQILELIDRLIEYFK